MLRYAWKLWVRMVHIPRRFCQGASICTRLPTTFSLEGHYVLPSCRCPYPNAMPMMIWRTHIGISFSISPLLRRIIVCLTTGSSSSMTSPLSIILRFAIKTLCLISLGHPDLEHVWDICVAHEEIWTANKDRLSARITTITVVVSGLKSHM